VVPRETEGNGRQRKRTEVGSWIPSNLIKGGLLSDKSAVSQTSSALRLARPPDSATMSLPQNELIRQTTISTLDHKDPHGPESDAGATQATADNASDAGKAGGVKRAEALYQVFGRKGKGVWLLWATIFLIAYVCKSLVAIEYAGHTLTQLIDELSNVLSFNFLAFATSSFGQHANLSTANVAVYVVGAIGQ
jgi:hypothetical protein